MDLIRWQRRSVVLSCFPLPLGARPLAFVLRPPEKTGHKSALFVRNVALKEKKKEKKKRTGPHKGGYSPGLTSGQMQRFGSHTSLSVVSSAIFLCTIFKKKCTQINKKKKRFTNAKLQKKIFLGRGSICIL